MMQLRGWPAKLRIQHLQKDRSNCPNQFGLITRSIHLKGVTFLLKREQNELNGNVFFIKEKAILNRNAYKTRNFF